MDRYGNPRKSGYYPDRRTVPSDQFVENQGLHGGYPHHSVPVPGPVGPFGPAGIPYHQSHMPFNGIHSRMAPPVPDFNGRAKPPGWGRGSGTPVPIPFPPNERTFPVPRRNGGHHNSSQPSPLDYGSGPEPFPEFRPETPVRDQSPHRFEKRRSRSISRPDGKQFDRRPSRPRGIPDETDPVRKRSRSFAAPRERSPTRRGSARRDPSPDPPRGVRSRSNSHSAAIPGDRRPSPLKLEFDNREGLQDLIRRPKQDPRFDLDHRETPPVSILPLPRRSSLHRSNTQPTIEIFISPNHQDKESDDDSGPSRRGRRRGSSHSINLKDQGVNIILNHPANSSRASFESRDDSSDDESPSKEDFHHPQQKRHDLADDGGRRIRRNSVSVPRAPAPPNNPVALRDQPHRRHTSLGPIKRTAMDSSPPYPTKNMMPDARKYSLGARPADLRDPAPAFRRRSWDEQPSNNRLKRSLSLDSRTSIRTAPPLAPQSEDGFHPQKPIHNIQDEPRTRRGSLRDPSRPIDRAPRPCQPSPEPITRESRARRLSIGGLPVPPTRIEHSSSPDGDNYRRERRKDQSRRDSYIVSGGSRLDLVDSDDTDRTDRARLSVDDRRNKPRRRDTGKHLSVPPPEPRSRKNSLPMSVASTKRTGRSNYSCNGNLVYLSNKVVKTYEAILDASDDISSDLKEGEGNHISPLTVLKIRKICVDIAGSEKLQFQFSNILAADRAWCTVMATNAINDLGSVATSLQTAIINAAVDFKKNYRKLSD